MTDKKILEARRARRMTQAHLAQAAGVSTRTVRRAESGAEISDENLRALYAVLDLDLGQPLDAASPGDVAVTPRIHVMRMPSAPVPDSPFLVSASRSQPPASSGAYLAGMLSDLLQGGLYALFGIGWLMNSVLSGMVAFTAPGYGAYLLSALAVVGLAAGWLLIELTPNGPEKHGIPLQRVKIALAIGLAPANFAILHLYAVDVGPAYALTYMAITGFSACMGFSALGITWKRAAQARPAF